MAYNEPSLKTGALLVLHLPPYNRYVIAEVVEPDPLVIKVTEEGPLSRIKQGGDTKFTVMKGHSIRIQSSVREREAFIREDNDEGWPIRSGLVQLGLEPGKELYEVEPQKFFAEDLVILQYSSDPFIIEVVAFDPHNLPDTVALVDLRAGTWVSKNLDSNLLWGNDHQIGGSRSCNSSRFGVIGIYNRTNNDHLTRMARTAHEAVRFRGMYQEG